jgi:hypothetical protein
LRDDGPEDIDRAQAGVDGARPPLHRQWHAGVALVDVQGQVLLLVEVAVVADQRLGAVGRVVSGIDVQDDLVRELSARADKQID